MRCDIVGQLFETGDEWVTNAVCNGVYAAENPVPKGAEVCDCVGGKP